MTNENLTDSDIIKALECCRVPVGSCECNNCPFDYQREKRLTGSDKSCTTLMFDCALDLINRQQAEIEQWKEEANKYQTLWCNSYDDIKSEAVREFAERLKKSIKKSVDNAWHSDGNGIYDAECVLDDIDNLVKEMVGEGA